MVLVSFFPLVATHQLSASSILVILSPSMSLLSQRIPSSRCSSRCLVPTVVSPDTFPSLISVYKLSRVSLSQDRLLGVTEEKLGPRWRRLPANQPARQGKMGEGAGAFIWNFYRKFPGTAEEKRRAKRKMQRGRVSRLK